MTAGGGSGGGKPRDHRQLGARLGKCVECGRTVWSNQPNEVVSSDPLRLRHKRC